MESQTVYYIVGVSRSPNWLPGQKDPKPATTYHVCEIKREDGARLDSLRKQRDESLAKLEAKKLLRGSEEYNSWYNIDVSARQRTYLGFLRRLRMKESGFFRDGKVHAKGEIVEKDAIDFSPCKSPEERIDLNW